MNKIEVSFRICAFWISLAKTFILRMYCPNSLLCHLCTTSILFETISIEMSLFIVIVHDVIKPGLVTVWHHQILHGLIIKSTFWDSKKNLPELQIVICTSFIALKGAIANFVQHLTFNVNVLQFVICQRVSGQ
jgi:hypothetical protein